MVGYAIPIVIALLIVEIFAANKAVILEHMSVFTIMLFTIFLFFVATFVVGEIISKAFGLDTSGVPRPEQVSEQDRQRLATNPGGA